MDIFYLLREKGPTAESIFTISPNVTSCKTLKEKLDSGKEVDIKKALGACSHLDSKVMTVIPIVIDNYVDIFGEDDHIICDDSQKRSDDMKTSVNTAEGTMKSLQHITFHNGNFLMTEEATMNKKKFKIKYIIPLNNLWAVDNVELVRKNETCPCKNLFLFWPDGNFLASFRSIDEAKKDIKKPFSLKIFTEDIPTCDSPLCVTATKFDKANDIIKKLRPMIRMPSSEEYQLWFHPGNGESPRALQGCESPHKVLMNHLQNHLGRWNSKISTAFPILPGFQQQNEMERPHKTKRPLMTSCFHRASVPHQDQMCTVPAVNKTGKLFGKELSSICDSGKWPKAILDILYRLREKGPTTKGIFVTSPNEISCKTLKEKLDSGEVVDIKNYSMHDMAWILKEFLRNIKGSLMTSRLYDQWLDVPQKINHDEKLTAVQRLVDKLPEPNAALLSQLFRILHEISRNASFNLMSSENLAAEIAQYILWIPSYHNNILANYITEKITLTSYGQNSPSNISKRMEIEHGISPCPSGRTYTPGHDSSPAITPAASSHYEDIVEKGEGNVDKTQQATSKTAPAPIKKQVFRKYPPISCLDRMLQSPILDMLSIIARRGQNSEQIFRFIPEKSHWSLRDKIYTEQEINCNEEPVLTVASVLKDFLRNIQGSLFSSDSCENWLSVLDEKSVLGKISAIQSIILLKMPQANYLLLKQLIHVLLKIKMSTRNNLDTYMLSVRIAPHVLWDQTGRNSLFGSDLSKKMSIIQIMIDNYVDIFRDEHHIIFDNNQKSSDDKKMSVNTAEQGTVKQLQHLTFHNGNFLMTDEDTLNKKKFKIKYIIPLNNLWAIDNVELVRKNETCPCKNLFLFWPDGNFWPPFVSIDEAKKDIKKPFSLKIFTGDIPTCDSPLCVTATKYEKMNDIIKKLLPMIRMPNTEDFELWFHPGHEEAPRALHGYESPYTVLMNHLQNNLGRWNSKNFTAFPILPGLFVKDLNMDADGQFILKPQKSARSQQQNETERPRKTKRPFMTSCFHRASVPHQDKIYTVPTVNKTGKFFGKELSSICENGKWPKAILDILYRLREKGPTTEGIFVTSPNETSCKTLKEKLDSGEVVDIENYSMHDVAWILKEFLRNIKGSLMTSQLYDEWLAVPQKINHKEKLKAVQSLIDKLPEPNAALLAQLIRILHEISRNASFNLMSSKNLAAEIAQYILWIPSYQKNVLANYITEKISLVTFLISNSPTIFGVDVVAVWYETSFFSPTGTLTSYSQNSPSNISKRMEIEHGISPCPSGRTYTPGHDSPAITPAASSHYEDIVEKREGNVDKTQQATSKTAPAPIKKQVFHTFPPITCLDRMLPSPILDMLSIIARRGQNSDQIFRFIPEKSHWSLRDKIYTEQEINWNEESVLTVASVLKDFIRNIQGSLLSSDLYENWLSVLDEKSLPGKISAIQRMSIIQIMIDNYLDIFGDEHAIIFAHNQKSSDDKKMSVNTAGDNETTSTSNFSQWKLPYD
ncbi:Predicted gene 1527 [Apodemus speciosus]|uniref:Predicted gene 1527 n=1 Tax=Apodemus speciosus TaxID=105296 RepID=A0ABQ0EJV5_APOSI